VNVRDHNHPAFPWRIVLFAAISLAVVAAGAGALWWARGGGRSPFGEQALDPVKEAAEMAEADESGWKNAAFFHASAGTAEGGSAERVTPFEGFALHVESHPDGARVTADDRLLGTTPIAVGFDCTPGEDVHLRIERPPFHSVKRATKCRENALVTIEVSLAR
jgi:hypothetical protein